MPPLITDLYAAIDAVLSHHQRLDRREALRAAVDSCLSDALDEHAFITRVCELFNATVVVA